MTEPEERDLAHEADMERLRREQLRADISPEEAADPDEYDEPYCICSVDHIIEELDNNQCFSCGREIT